MGRPAKNPEMGIQRYRRIVEAILEKPLLPGAVVSPLSITPPAATNTDGSSV